MVSNVINTSGITTDANGKLQVSGLGSSIDWKTIVKAQVQARRVPADRLETKIDQNNTLVSAYGEIRTLTQKFSGTLDKLRSAPGSSVDVFKSKIASGTTAAAPSAPSGFTPSSINSLLLTSIGPQAQNGTYTVKVDALAAAQQIRSDVVSSTTTALADLGFTPGTFSLGGKTITVSATDTLQDLRANINAAGAGVTASVVTVNPTTNYLVLTASQTGVANAANFAGGNSLTDSLGLTNAGTVKNQLTPPADASITINGISGITRSSNTIDDAVTGVTLNLIKAEPNTVITLKVEPDLNTIKTALSDFVNSYNEIRTFYAEQRRAADRNDDGKVEDNELGPLAYDQRLRDMVGQMGLMVSSSVDTNADGFRSLSQIGISIESDFSLKINDSTLDARLLNNVAEVQKLFSFNATSTDSRVTVLNRGAATQSGTYYLNVGGTDANGVVTSANLQTTAGAGTGGANNGSLTINGQILTGASGNGSGLSLFFNGGNNLGAVNDIGITISRGIADQFFNYFDDLGKPSVGGFDVAANDLVLQNQDYTARIDTIDTRIEVFRANLESRFVRMEQALAQLETLRTTLDSYVNNQNND